MLGLTLDEYTDTKNNLKQLSKPLALIRPMDTDSLELRQKVQLRNQTHATTSTKRDNLVFCINLTCAPTNSLT